MEESEEDSEEDTANEAEVVEEHEKVAEQERAREAPMATGTNETPAVRVASVPLASATPAMAAIPIIPVRLTRDPSTFTSASTPLSTPPPTATPRSTTPSTPTIPLASLARPSAVSVVILPGETPADFRHREAEEWRKSTSQLPGDTGGAATMGWLVAFLWSGMCCQLTVAPVPTPKLCKSVKMGARDFPR